MSSIWIPYIIFRNTDRDDAVDIKNTRAVVSIKRQGNFVRSGLDVADEVVQHIPLKDLLLNPLKIEIFNGGENMITLNQTHSKKFHCTYLLHYYPFDTQVKRL